MIALKHSSGQWNDMPKTPSAINVALIKFFTTTLIIHELAHKDILF